MKKVLIGAICALGMFSVAASTGNGVHLGISYLQQDEMSGGDVLLSLPFTKHTSFQFSYGQLEDDHVTEKNKGFAVKYRNDFKEQLFVTSKIGYFGETVSHYEQSRNHWRGEIGVGSGIGERFEYEVGADHLEYISDKFEAETGGYLRVGVNFTQSLQLNLFHRSTLKQSGAELVYTF